MSYRSFGNRKGEYPLKASIDAFSSKVGGFDFENGGSNMKVLLRNQNSHELFLLGLQEIAGLGYSGNPSRSVNCAVDFLRLPHPLDLKKKSGLAVF